jgi:hypothetical protein
MSGNSPLVQPRLSSDGNHILYLVNPSAGDADLETALTSVPLAGGAAKPLVKAKWISNHQCARTPATLCLYSAVADSGLTFYKFDPSTGSAAQVYQVKDEVPLLYNWSLSPDGTTLALAKGKFGDDKPRIHLVSLNGAAEKWLNVQGWPGIAALDWAADSKSLWVTTVSEKDNALLRVDLQSRVRVAWRPRNLNVGWAIPSRDGKYVALHVNSGSANVWMLEH